MHSYLLAGDHGIPLTLVETSDYDRWFDEQSEPLQNWLTCTDFKGEGISLIPGEEGVVDQVIVGVEDLSSHFICGNLVNQLPAGDYKLQGDENLLRLAAFSWGLGAYQFDRYKKTEQKERPRLILPRQAEVVEAEKFVKAIAIVRDLVNTPAGDMMPEHLGEAVEKLAEEFGAKVSQTVGDELLTQNYPTIHAVGRASSHAPRLIDMTWGDEKHPLITLVGKGVCFDSGGLDMKGADGMRLMKKDMGGAAHVIGLARLIMSFNLPVRLRMLIPAVENAVAGNALRPGDIVKTRQGLTVEIHNTDAEGRLVLCEALTEASTENPDMIVDFATLTGACRVALGTEVGGFYTDDTALACELMQAGDKTDDPIWRMPLHKDYRYMLNSEIADMTNCAKEPYGGSITAALYLQEFVGKGIPWVHFDIMAWNIRPQPGRPVGGEAFGVRAVFEVLQDRYGQ